MKLIHIIASCFLTFACVNMWTGMISSCHKTIVETQRIERSLERDSFLYEGFNKICSSKTGIEWQSEMFEWKKLGMLAGGFLLGSYGVKILGSRDAKKLYTHTAAAALRMKDEVMKDVTTIRENAEDIAADAKEMNEQRRQEEEARIIEDAKAVLEAAQAEEVDQ